MTERWRPVVGHEGHYSVSDAGRVRSETRVLFRANGSLYTRVGRILKQHAHYRTGYMRVGLRSIGRLETTEVHRLVLAAFVGECPPGKESLHWDDVPSNNRLSNLRYGTKSENQLDQVRNGRHRNANATHCKKGHEFTPENTYWRSRQNGGRACRECHRACDRRRRQQIGRAV